MKTWDLERSVSPLSKRRTWVNNSILFGLEENSKDQFRSEWDRSIVIGRFRIVRY